MLDPRHGCWRYTRRTWHLCLNILHRRLCLARQLRLDVLWVGLVDLRGARQLCLDVLHGCWKWPQWPRGSASSCNIKTLRLLRAWLLLLVWVGLHLGRYSTPRGALPLLLAHRLATAPAAGELASPVQRC